MRPERQFGDAILIDLLPHLRVCSIHVDNRWGRLVDDKGRDKGMSNKRPEALMF